jgi:adenylylsulfate kinase-like enzyme
LYRLARAGTLKNFTGITSAYEAPEGAELELDTAQLPLEECVRRIVALVTAP